MKTEQEMIERLNDLNSTMEVVVDQMVSEPDNEEVREKLIDLVATFEAIAWVLEVEDRFAVSIAKVRAFVQVLPRSVKEVA